jgi:putative transposase
MQRRGDRKRIFKAASDMMRYLLEICALRNAHPFRLLSYCLMPNHAHLLVSPHPSNQGASFQAACLSLARVPSIARLNWNLGTEAVAVSSRRLLVWARYLDLNPVEARMVERPELFEWSAYRARIGLACFPQLDSDPAFIELGETPQEQRNRYREYVERGIHRRKPYSIHAEW